VSDEVRHCHDCGQVISVEQGAKTERQYGLFLCDPCAEKRPTLDEKWRLRKREKLYYTIERDFPEVAKFLEQ
jgi:hypothetical protein